MTSRKFYEAAENGWRCYQSRRPIAVYDVETTGLKTDECNIIQFSGVLYEFQDDGYRKTDECNFYVHQDLPLPPVIIDVTKITDDMLKKHGIPEQEAADRIIEFLSKARIFIAYNGIRFDNAVIDNFVFRNRQKHFVPRNVADPYRIAKELIKADTLQDNSYKLCNVASYYQTQDYGEFHNSLVDTMTTWEVFESEMEDFRQSKENEEKNKRPDSTHAELSVQGCRYWHPSSIIDRHAPARQPYRRLYIQTNLGVYFYDFNSMEIGSKDETAPEIDAHELGKKVNTFLGKKVIPEP